MSELTNNINIGVSKQVAVDLSIDNTVDIGIKYTIDQQDQPNEA